MTQTATLTRTITFTCSPSPTPDAGGDITLKFKTTDTNATTNSPHPWFQLYNDDNSLLDLSTVEIRYWYFYEAGWGGSTSLEQSIIDYSGKFPSGNNITSSTIHSIVSGSFGDNQDRYLKITFNSGAGSIAQGEYVQIQSRFNKTDWSNYDQGNDWSFVGYSTFADWDKVTVYINGTLVWGTEPGGIGILNLKGGYEILEYQPLNEETTYNYPNPCKDETIVRFSLTKQADVSIMIVDMKGTLVWSRQFSAAETRRGINHFTWKTANDEGKSVANGVYVLRIITDDASVTKKIAVIK